jgi:hypothetical protein
MKLHNLLLIILLLVFLLYNCTKQNFNDTSYICKAYIESFNRRNLTELRQYTIENKSDIEIKNIFSLWENLKTTVEILSLKETSSTENEIVFDIVLQYEIEVENEKKTEIEQHEFILIKNNAQWKIKRGLL